MGARALLKSTNTLVLLSSSFPALNFQDVLGAQEVLYSLTSLKRDCSKEELLGEMLKILLKYSGAQKGTFLVGENIGSFFSMDGIHVVQILMGER